MLNLSEYRAKPQGLADFLPWAALVAPGVLLNKDGSFQRTASFRGPDLDSATPAELVTTTARLNNALRRLDSGWAIFVEAQRHPAGGYPASTFPDIASALVDAERRAQFDEAGAHYEPSYYLTLLWLPPAKDAATAEAWLYEGSSDRTASGREALAGFIDRADRVLAMVEGFMPEAAWLGDPETLAYLHSTVSTRRHGVRVQETPMHLDAILADAFVILCRSFSQYSSHSSARSENARRTRAQAWPYLAFVKILVTLVSHVETRNVHVEPANTLGFTWHDPVSGRRGDSAPHRASGAWRKPGQAVRLGLFWRVGH